MRQSRSRCPSFESLSVSVASKIFAPVRISSSLKSKGYKKIKMQISLQRNPQAEKPKMLQLAVVAAKMKMQDSYQLSPRWPRRVVHLSAN